MKRKKKISSLKNVKKTNKKCRNEQNSDELSLVEVKRHDSLVSSNWEKLSKLVGYDPNARKNHVARTFQHKSHVPRRKLNCNVNSSQKKSVVPESVSSEQPDAVADCSKCDDVINEISQKHANRSQVTNGSVHHSEYPIYEPKNLTRAIAMDCEMVGTGSGGSDSMLARVSIVNSLGQCVYNKYVLPRIKVTDYRTAISGIRPKNLKNGEKFEIVQKEVAEILKGRILVGHALKNDFKVLYFSHPRRWIRDTSAYKPFQKTCGTRTPSLKKLASLLLNTKIQTGEHDSIEDAQTAMLIYSQYKKEWETHERKKKHKREQPKTD